MSRSIGLWLQYLICSVAALLVGVPLVNSVLGGFQSTAQLQNQPFGPPNPVHAENYARIVEGARSGSSLPTARS